MRKLKEAKEFCQIPQIIPSTYNGRSVYSKYNITISIPLKG
jgi:hypothetical protein